MSRSAKTLRVGTDIVMLAGHRVGWDGVTLLRTTLKKAATNVAGKHLANAADKTLAMMQREVRGFNPRI